MHTCDTVGTLNLSNQRVKHNSMRIYVIRDQDQMTQPTNLFHLSHIMASKTLVLEPDLLQVASECVYFKHVLVVLPYLISEFRLQAMNHFNRDFNVCVCLSVIERTILV